MTGRHFQLVGKPSCLLQAAVMFHGVVDAPDAAEPCTKMLTAVHCTSCVVCPCQGGNGHAKLLANIIFFLFRSSALFTLSICLVNPFITQSAKETSPDLCQISKAPPKRALEYNSKIINWPRRVAKPHQSQKKGPQ